MKLSEIAWLAGLLEGEGCFQVRKSGGYKGTVCIALQMTDADIVRRASQMMGGTFYGPHGPYGASKLPTYQTMIFGTKAASWMMTLYTFLGERRKKKVTELLDMWKSQVVMRVGRIPDCHRDRPYCAKGLCEVCYNKQYHDSHKHAHIAS